MIVLVLNPGGNSLKAEVADCPPGQAWAFEGRMLASAAVEGVGQKPRLLEYDAKKTVGETAVVAGDVAESVDSLLRFLRDKGIGDSQIECVGVRVVHGGESFHEPALIDNRVETEIHRLQRLAPLHNQRSLAVLPPVRRRLPSVPVYAVFDTAFHRTIPEHVRQYALDPKLTSRLGIRRFGFHGISQRYVLERYAHLVGKSPQACSVVSMHLESGCSVTAIRDGQSMDNTMGLTPLEGLMMGTRSGDIDPSIVALLMKDENLSVDDVMSLLNKKSGLLAVSGRSLDTRLLMEDYEQNPRARLAMDMFVYRVRKAVGGYLAALGSAEAVLFAGGIAENGVFLRHSVCEGLRGFGMEIDADANRCLVDTEGRLSTTDSRLAAWVIPVEEGLQIAHECAAMMWQR